MQGSGSVRIRRSKRASVALEAAIGAVVLTAASAYGLQAYQEIALATDLKRMTTVLAESVARLDIAANVGSSPTSLAALHPSLVPFFASNGPVRGITDQFLEQYGGAPDASVHSATIDLDRVEVEAALIDFRAISLDGGVLGDFVSALDNLVVVAQNGPVSAVDVGNELGIPAFQVNGALGLSGLTINEINDFVGIYEALGNTGDRVGSASGGTIIFLPRFLGPNPTSTTYGWNADRPGTSGTSCMGSTPLTVQNVLSGSVFGGFQVELAGSVLHQSNATNPGVRGKPFLADHVQVMALVRSCVRIRNRTPGGGVREFVAVHAVPISDQLTPFDGAVSASTDLSQAGLRAVGCWGRLSPSERNAYGILRCLI